MIDYNLKIDLQGDRAKHTDIVFTTGDNRGYKLNFSFYSYGEKVDISDYTVTVKAKREDGQVIIDIGETVGTVASYVVAGNMYAVPGDVKLEVGLIGPDGSLVTSCVLQCAVREGFGEKGLETKNTTPILERTATIAKKAEIAAGEVKDAVEHIRLEMVEQLENKVDKVEGKGLSTNDFTDEEKTKVADTHNKVFGLGGIDYIWSELGGVRINIDQMASEIDELSKNQVMNATTYKSPITDCTDGPVASLNLYGYSFVYPTPSPENPTQITGSDAPRMYGCGVESYVSNPDILFGVPVASGGNFTDASGQQWICDEIDFVNKKYIKRCYMYELTGNEKFYEASASWYDENTFSVYMSLGATNLATSNATAQSSQCLSTHLQNALYGFADITKPNSVSVYHLAGKPDSILAVKFENRLTGIASSDSIAGKIEQIKAYITSLAQSGNPIRVLYPLYTPIEMEFTDERALDAFAQMRTTYPVSTFESSANFLIGYKATVQGYVDNKFEKLTNAIISLGGNV